MNTNKSNLYLHSNKFYEKMYNNLELIEKQNINTFYFQDILSKNYIDKINKGNIAYNEIENYNNNIYEYLNTIFDDIKLNSNQQQNNSIIIELKKSLVYKANYMAMVQNECIEHMNILRALYTKYIIQSRINIGDIINITFDKKNVIKSDETTNHILGELFSRYIISYADYDYTHNESYNQQSSNQSQNTKNTNELSTQSQRNSIALDCKQTIYYKEKLYNDISDFTTYEICFKYWFIQLIIIELLFNNNSNYSVLFNSDLFEKEVNEVCKYVKVVKEGQKSKKKKPQGQQYHKGGAFKRNDALATLHETVKNNNKRFNFKKGTKKTSPQQSKQQGNNNKNKFKKQSKYITLMKKIKIGTTSYDETLTKNLRSDIIKYYEEHTFNTPKVKSVFTQYTPAEITFNNFLSKAEENEYKEKNMETPENTIKRNDKKAKKMGDKLNIFNMLWCYVENISDIIKFIRNVQKYILYVNYMLYYKKKQFYTMFLNNYDKLYRSTLSINSSPQTIQNIQNKKIIHELTKYNVRIHQYIKILLLKKDKLLQMQHELNNSPQSNLKKHIITKQLNYIYIELEKARTSNYVEKIIKNIINKQQKQ